MTTTDPDEGKRQLTADLAEIFRFAGPRPDPAYLAGLLLDAIREGRYTVAASFAPHPAAVPPAFTESKCIIGERCDRHDFVHGGEAEELREKLAKTRNSLVMRVLEEVDARDSAAWVEVKKRINEEDWPAPGPGVAAPSRWDQAVIDCSARKRGITCSVHGAPAPGVPPEGPPTGQKGEG